MFKNKVVWIIIAIVAILFFWVKGVYNNMVTQDEGVKTAWSQVENQYQRRMDLIPNLVNTVKGYAAHEKETLEGVVNARAEVLKYGLLAFQVKIRAGAGLFRDHPRTDQLVAVVPCGELPRCDAPLGGVEEDVASLVADEERGLLQGLAVADADAEAGAMACRHRARGVDPVYLAGSASGIFCTLPLIMGLETFRQVVGPSRIQRTVLTF